MTTIQFEGLVFDDEAAAGFTISQWARGLVSKWNRLTQLCVNSAPCNLVGFRQLLG